MLAKTKDYPILTPKPKETPKINGPKIFGVRPNAPFLFKIPATGKKPLKYEAEQLPSSLSVDNKTGIITGLIKEKGTYNVTFIVSNKLGKASRQFKIIVGDEICLTPPMGWNSWYVHSLWVSQKKVEAMAKAMVDSGLIDHGWTYINIDDAWQGERDMEGTKSLQPNPKFPNMKKMCDYIHSLGLKAGIYSTPWIGTYAGYQGGSIPNPNADYSEWIVEEKDRLEKYQIFGNPIHLRRRLYQKFGTDMSEIDAKQFSEWGFDYLKYDWHPNDIEHITLMRDALLKCGRDLVYSLSNSTPFKLIDKIKDLANVWRTTGDIIDYWVRVAQIGFSQDKWAPFASRGHWNDPDMLQIGMTAHPHKPASEFFPSHLTADEQYSQMSLWCLLSAPLLLSCDLTKLDEFTKNLLTNDEVIEINQDPLGKSARRLHINKFRRIEIWGKILEDGRWAIGVFNRAPFTQYFTLKFKNIRLDGPFMIRDLWRQKNLGVFKHNFKTRLKKHGVTLITLTKNA